MESGGVDVGVRVFLRWWIDGWSSVCRGGGGFARGVFIDRIPSSRARGSNVCIYCHTNAGA